MDVRPFGKESKEKHAEKTRVGLWGHSVILKAIWGLTFAIGDEVEGICVKLFHMN